MGSPRTDHFAAGGCLYTKLHVLVDVFIFDEGAFGCLQTVAFGRSRNKAIQDARIHCNNGRHYRYATPLLQCNLHPSRWIRRSRYAEIAG